MIQPLEIIAIKSSRLFLGFPMGFPWASPAQFAHAVKAKKARHLRHHDMDTTNGGF